jgi:hypothetical protein
MVRRRPPWTGRRGSAAVGGAGREVPGRNPADLTRARAAVTAWRDQNPAGTSDELVAAFGRHFHPDYGVVLRAVLFAVDRHRAREVTGIATGLPVSRGSI